VLLVLPGVARERQPEPAELAEHRGALLLDRRARRAGIARDVVDRADAIVVSAARADDEAARIVLLDPLRHGDGVELPPRLVERHPHRDRRMVAERVDHLLELASIGLGRLRAAADLAFGLVVELAERVPPRV